MREFPGKRRKTFGLDDLTTKLLKKWMSMQAHAWSGISPTVRKPMPNTHRRRDETVLSRRRQRCEHEFATSWRQFRRVVGVNTSVGSRDEVYNFLC